MLNVFSLAILALIYFNLHSRHDSLLVEQKLYLLLVGALAVILVTDTLMWVLDGLAGQLKHMVNVIATVIYYALNPAICVIWYFYVDFQLYKNVQRLKRLLLPLSLPAVLNLALAIVSPFNGALFYFDATNVYHRGWLFLATGTISLFYLLFSWVSTVLKRHKLPKQDFFPIALFLLFPLVGGIVQVLFYGLSVVWPCTTFATLIIFFSLQNIQLYTDHLTGLYNRRQLDRFLNNKLPNSTGKILAGLMIDLDSFKRINDCHGHVAGDQALVDTAILLKHTFAKQDFIFRFGGDEFVVIMVIEAEDELRHAITRLQENVAHFNAKSTAPYALSLSIGGDCIFDTTGCSAKEFLRHIDGLMYQNKQHRQYERA